MNQKPSFRGLPHTPKSAFLLALLIGGANTIAAADAATANKPAVVPSWKGEISLTGKIGYDSNVLATDTTRPGYDYANQEAWTWTTTLKGTAYPLVPFGFQKTDLSLTLSAVDTRYAGLASENNTAYRLQGTTTHKIGALSWSADAGVLYVDGSKTSIRYLTYSAYGLAIPRERRNQLQETAKANVKYEFASSFLRATGSLLAYDLLTEHHNPTGSWTGCMNFSDRYDINGGIDVGYKTSKASAVFVGWRNGYQFQQSYSWNTASGSNHYQRLLVGFEGKIGDSFTATLAVGPDYRRFDDARSSSELRPTTIFVEGNLAYTPNKANTVSLTLKQLRWLSSTGKTVYDEKNALLSWKHSYGAAWTSTLSAQFQQSDYVLPAVRNDNLYTLGASVGWKVTPKTTLALDYSHAVTDSLIDGPSANGRNFERHQIGLSAAYAF